ncbi:porin [Rhizobium sp. S163]|uniref:porin n=1 Tax=Rhizobium sp. S163 TaxID=3055039 RepID=UPI0025A9CEB4|nr:porin [Rhizobium sp. S163]MDM9648246.1 porin [Rhizobium sp. S163]
MNIKSLLLGSAAALAVVSGAQAADAIVAAEPEAVEYVRVCDAYGTGYFYIPGTETCLKIEGYIRFQVNGGDSLVGSSDWNSFTRGNVQFTAKSDTEYGPLTGVIVLQTDANNASDQNSYLDSAYIDIAGFRAGLFYSWWDDGLSGETDSLASNATLHNSIRYQYESGDFYAGISVDELEDSVSFGESGNDVGIAAGIGGKAGAFSYQVIGGYDTDTSEGAVRGMATVAIGPGTLGLAAAWASGANAYYEESEWTVAAEYAIQATDKLKITPGVQYFANINPVTGIPGVGKNAMGTNADWADADLWKAGVTLDYQIVENFYAKASVQWQDRTSVADSDDTVSGYFRLQRAF